MSLLLYTKSLYCLAEAKRFLYKILPEETKYKNAIFISKLFKCILNVIFS